MSVFQHNISKINATRVTRLDIEMFHHESWSRSYVWVERSKVKVMRHKNSATVGFDTLVSADFF